ncbi:ABC transporter ATP-binding protein [Bermanella sp. R86510]|uniref:ABC transporter ATP-binding protein n=1 Tax=unclassified Bermanella TaxID=2627862 RepID=UPI0037CA48F3
MSRSDSHLHNPELQSQWAVEIEQAMFAYEEGQPVIHVPSWRLAKGQHVFLQGESGSGKSTLLNLLAGLNVVDNGSLNILGQSLKTLSASKRDRFRAQHIGVVYQAFNLIPYLSVKHNIQLAQYFASTSQYLDTIDALLSAVNLPKSCFNKPVSHLSIGQQQRVAIVRALVNHPPLLLADEPTSALDRKNMQSFMQTLMSAVEHTETSVIMVSHDERMTDYFEHHVQISDINKIESEQRVTL